jgi:hypothetical protein
MIYYKVAFETTNCLRPLIEYLFAYDSATTRPIIINACTDFFLITLYLESGKF